MAPLQGQGILSDQGSWKAGPGTYTPRAASWLPGLRPVSLVPDTCPRAGNGRLWVTGWLSGASLESSGPALTHSLAWLSTP